jgi:hypothetical protein
MTWAMSLFLRSSIGTLAVAGVLFALPTVTASVPAYAAPTDAPQPPPPPSAAAQPGHGEYYSPNDTEDWWPYAGTGSF